MRYNFRFSFSANNNLVNDKVTLNGKDGVSPLDPIAILFTEFFKEENSDNIDLYCFWLEGETIHFIRATYSVMQGYSCKQWLSHVDNPDNDEEPSDALDLTSEFVAKMATRSKRKVS